MGNIAIVQEVYDAFERQDLEGLLASVDPVLAASTFPAVLPSCT
jgi:ketosteroid isomerase-like protein